MITPGEEDFIRNHAYVPEHIPGYGAAMSQGEPCIWGDFLSYRSKDLLIFVGYPLQGPFDVSRMEQTLKEAIRKFQPSRVALPAPSISSRLGAASAEDAYFRLDLASLRIPSKVRNMIRRAGRDLRVRMGGEFTAEHRTLIEKFVREHPLDEGTHYIFRRIPDYLASVPSSRLMEARDPGGNLVAFDVAEFGARDYAFYLFNFRSTRHSIPGASDLLLHALIGEAQKQGKCFVNLGLGINPKVAFFKEKWGALPFLRYRFLVFRPSPPSIFNSIWKGWIKE